jgi:hypothetical protein
LRRYLAQWSAYSADTTILLDQDQNGRTLYVRGRDVRKGNGGTFAGGIFDPGEASEARFRTTVVIIAALTDHGEPMTPLEIADTGQPRANVQLLRKWQKRELEGHAYCRVLHPSNSGL